MALRCDGWDGQCGVGKGKGEGPAHRIQPYGVERDDAAIFGSGVEGHVTAVGQPQPALLIARIIPVRLNAVLKQHEVPLPVEVGHVH